MTRGSLAAAAVRRRIRSPATAAGVAVVRLGFALGLLRRPAARIVLATRDTGRVGGNLLAIRQEIESRRLGIPIRVVGFRMRGGVRGRAAAAVEGFRIGYELAASRVFIGDDWCFPLFVTWPRRGTTRIQVWHAAGAFKKFGFSVAAVPGSDAEQALALRMTSNWDLCLASSAAAVEPLAEAFRLPPERFTTAIGLPRTDALVDPERRAAAADAVRRRYGLGPDERLLLFAPTFRGEQARDAHYDDSLDLAAMQAALSGAWRLLLRLHPMVRDGVPIGPDLSEFVVDVSDWPDMTGLLAVADMLVTDYSSTVFEYALLGRPIAFFAPDLDAYVQSRGFYMRVPEDLPGPVFRTTSELAAHVAEGQFDIEGVRAFAERWFEVADGAASARFVDRIVLPAVGGGRPGPLPPVDR